MRTMLKIISVSLFGILLVGLHSFQDETALVWRSVTQVYFARYASAEEIMERVETLPLDESEKVRHATFNVEVDMEILKLDAEHGEIVGVNMEAVDVNVFGEQHAVSEDVDHKEGTVELQAKPEIADGKVEIISDTNEQVAEHLVEMVSHANEIGSDPSDGGDSVQQPVVDVNNWNKSIPISVAFYNQMKKDVRLFYKSAAKVPDSDFGLLAVGETTTITSYQDHVWYAQDLETGEKLQTIAVSFEESSYVFEPKEIRDARDEIYHQERRKFMQEYKSRTGINWIAVYPRKPVSFRMWESGEVGRIQYAETTSGFWYNHTKEDCDPTVVDEDADDELEEDAPDDEEDDTPNVFPHIMNHKYAGCMDLSVPEPQKTKIKVETLSVSPQVFAFYDVMSEDEADLILQMVQPFLERSLVTTTGQLSDGRTSDTCWVAHEDNDVILNIFHRIADVLRIPREKVENLFSAESLQIVRYNTSGEYQEHHDYLDPMLHEEEPYVTRGNNRLATFLFYLKTPEEGGETHFPLSNAVEEGQGGLKAKMKKGSAVMFYSMLPDGNLDAKSLHAGLPVIKGEKYISNLWIWEPRFK